MNKSQIYALIAVGVVVAGCSKSIRSISHSDYPEQAARQGYCSDDKAVIDPGFEYRGELSEFDVLGIARDEITSEADIQRALQQARPLKLSSGSSILLIQSGALYPDNRMVDELSKQFRVIPFPGVPNTRRSSAGGQTTISSDPESYSRSLRLTAARGGADFILCYWGFLESERERLPTKTVSWVPVVNWVLPDEKQEMHIRLKMALVDVRSGNWSVLSCKRFDQSNIMTTPRRRAVDQKQVERLKNLAYQASVAELVRTFD